MKSGEGGAQIFTLQKSCSTTTNYYYSVRGTNAISNLSNVISTPAWSFWEPTCLTTRLTQWLDATETSTVTLVSSDVSAWKDKSSNSKDLTQATASRRPTYTTNKFGTGLHAIDFDGSQTLRRDSFIYAQGSSTIFSVMRGAGGSSDRYVVSEGQDINVPTDERSYYSPLGANATDTIGGRFVFENTVKVSFNNTGSLLFDGTIKLAMTEDTGSLFLPYINGTATGVNTSYTFLRSSSYVNTYVLGARYAEGLLDGEFTGSIGEFIVINGTLLESDRQKLEGYSAHKWEVRGNLEVAHPYSVTPP